MNRFVYTTATVVTKYFLLPLYARIEVHGLENLPLEWPLIIASNHQTDADPGIICTRIRRPIAFMAKIELFRIPLLKQFLYGFGAFPVRRGEADISALRKSQENLALGKVEFFVDNQLISTLEQAPFAIPWQAGPGKHALRVKATDRAGNTGEAQVTLFVTQ